MLLFCTKIVMGPVNWSISLFYILNILSLFDTPKREFKSKEDYCFRMFQFHPENNI